MMCWCSFVCSFCLFKQKTAYEMRISDWSSDVCSSDLGALARQLLPLHPGRTQGAAQGILGLVPGGVVAHPRLRAQGKLDLHVLESEILVDLHRLGVEVGDLGLDLVLGAEHVAVVLGEAAHAQDPEIGRAHV